MLLLMHLMHKSPTSQRTVRQQLHSRFGADPSTLRNAFAEDKSKPSTLMYDLK